MWPCLTGLINHKYKIQYEVQTGSEKYSVPEYNVKMYNIKTQ